MRTKAEKNHRRAAEEKMKLSLPSPKVVLNASECARLLDGTGKTSVLLVEKGGKMVPAASVAPPLAVSSSEATSSSSDSVATPKNISTIDSQAQDNLKPNAEDEKVNDSVAEIKDSNCGIQKDVTVSSSKVILKPPKKRRGLDKKFESSNPPLAVINNGDLSHQPSPLREHVDVSSVPQIAEKHSKPEQPRKADFAQKHSMENLLQHQPSSSMSSANIVLSNFAHHATFDPRASHLSQTALVADTIPSSSPASPVSISQPASTEGYQSISSYHLALSQPSSQLYSHSSFTASAHSINHVTMPYSSQTTQTVVFNMNAQTPQTIAFLNKQISPNEHSPSPSMSLLATSASNSLTVSPSFQHLPEQEEPMNLSKSCKTAAGVISLQTHSNSSTNVNECRTAEDISVNIVSQHSPIQGQTHNSDFNIEALPADPLPAKKTDLKKQRKKLSKAQKTAVAEPHEILLTDCSHNGIVDYKKSVNKKSVLPSPASADANVDSPDSNSQLLSKLANDSMLAKEQNLSKEAPLLSQASDGVSVNVQSPKSSEMASPPSQITSTHSSEAPLNSSSLCENKLMPSTEPLFIEKKSKRPPKKKVEIPMDKESCEKRRALYSETIEHVISNFIYTPEPVEEFVLTEEEEAAIRDQFEDHPETTKKDNGFSRKVIGDNKLIQNVTGDNTNSQKVIDDNTSSQKVIDDNTHFQNITGDNAISKKVTIDNTSSKNVTDDNTSGKKLTDDNTCSQNDTYSQNTTDDNTNHQKVADNSVVILPSNQAHGQTQTDLSDSETETLVIRPLKPIKKRPNNSVAAKSLLVRPKKESQTAMAGHIDSILAFVAADVFNTTPPVESGLGDELIKQQKMSTVDQETVGISQNNNNKIDNNTRETYSDLGKNNNEIFIINPDKTVMMMVNAVKLDGEINKQTKVKKIKKKLNSLEKPALLSDVCPTCPEDALAEKNCEDIVKKESEVHSELVEKANLDMYEPVIPFNGDTLPVTDKEILNTNRAETSDIGESIASTSGGSEQDTPIHEPETKDELISADPLGAEKESQDTGLESGGDDSKPLKKYKKRLDFVKCAHCEHQARGRSALSRHMKKIHMMDVNMPYKCHKCDYGCTKMASLNRHLFTHGVFPCSRCNFVADERIKLGQHVMEQHRDKLDMKLCKVCNRYIKCDLITIEAHTDSCQGPTPFKCAECEKEFKYASSLRVHYHTHFPDQPKRFKCEQCEYRTNYKANLHKHHKNMHASRDRDVQCPDCAKLFSTEDNMRRHRKVHTLVRPFACEICKKTFKTSGALKGHHLIHTATRPYSCNIPGCNRSFRTPKFLKSHQEEFHRLVPKKFFCSVDGCNYSFFKRSHLKRHAITHTGERNFHCTWPGCIKSFRHADNLKVHFRSHTNEKPVQCHLCDFKCKQKNSLFWHKKKVHHIIDVSVCPRRSENRLKTKEGVKIEDQTEALESQEDEAEPLAVEVTQGSVDDSELENLRATQADSFTSSDNSVEANESIDSQSKIVPDLKSLASEAKQALAKAHPFLNEKQPPSEPKPSVKEQSISTQTPISRDYGPRDLYEFNSDNESEEETPGNFRRDKISRTILTPLPPPPKELLRKNEMLERKEKEKKEKAEKRELEKKEKAEKREQEKKEKAEKKELEKKEKNEKKEQEKKEKAEKKLLEKKEKAEKKEKERQEKDLEKKERAEKKLLEKAEIKKKEEKITVDLNAKEKADKAENKKNKKALKVRRKRSSSILNTEEVNRVIEEVEHVRPSRKKRGKSAEPLKNDDHTSVKEELAPSPAKRKKMLPKQSELPDVSSQRVNSPRIVSRKAATPKVHVANKGKKKSRSVPPKRKPSARIRAKKKATAKVKTVVKASKSQKIIPKKKPLRKKSSTKEIEVEEEEKVTESLTQEELPIAENKVEDKKVSPHRKSEESKRTEDKSREESEEQHNVSQRPVSPTYSEEMMLQGKASPYRDFSDAETVEDDDAGGACKQESDRKLSSSADDNTPSVQEEKKDLEDEEFMSESNKEEDDEDSKSVAPAADESSDDEVSNDIPLTPPRAPAPPPMESSEDEMEPEPSITPFSVPGPNTPFSVHGPNTPFSVPPPTNLIQQNSVHSEEAPMSVIPSVPSMEMHSQGSVEMQQPLGSVEMNHPRSVEMSHSHGSAEMHHPHGSVEMHHPHGSVEMHHPHGSVEMHHPHGSVEMHHPHGSVEVHHPHGSVEMHHSHGSVEMHHPHGSVEMHHPHGSAEMHHPHGSAEMHHTHGSVEMHHLHGSAEMHHPHGSAEMHHSHGSVEMHHPHGSLDIHHSHGSVEMHSHNTQNEMHSHSSGEIRRHGSTEMVQPHGSVEMHSSLQEPQSEQQQLGSVRTPDSVVREVKYDLPPLHDQNQTTDADKEYFDQYLKSLSAANNRAANGGLESQSSGLRELEAMVGKSHQDLRDMASKSPINSLPNSVITSLESTLPILGPGDLRARMDVFDRHHESLYVRDTPSSLPRLSDRQSTTPLPPNPAFDAFPSLNSLHPVATGASGRESSYLRQPDNLFPTPPVTSNFMAEAMFQRQAMSTPFLPPQPSDRSSLSRIPDTTQLRSNSSSLLRRTSTMPGADMFSSPTMPQTMPRNPFTNAWASQDTRSTHWQTPYLPRQPNMTTPSSFFPPKDNYLTGREFMFDPSVRQSAERGMFPSLSTSQTQDTFQLDRFDLSNYFPNAMTPYASSTGSLDYARSAHSAASKPFDERYRQSATTIPDFRGLPPSTGSSDMFSGLPSVNSGFNLYSSNPMSYHHPQHMTDNVNSAFLTHSTSTQHAMFERDYAAAAAHRGLYSQNTPYPFIDDRQYGPSSKLTHSHPVAPATATQERDLMSRHFAKPNFFKIKWLNSKCTIIIKNNNNDLSVLILFYSLKKDTKKYVCISYSYF
ncbi:hypothetical protein Btru_037999 [Bulinus truncatus]|nr:hypothetical protein Btru_037999 [Bulinus truncatus]